jgi:uncharacterized protein with HEPN domain
MERDQASILDAIRFAELILEFTKGMDEQIFYSDLKTQAAVLYEIAILGEAIKRLSLEFREQHPEIPYSKIIGMRNRLTHDYGRVDLEVVWRVIKTEIPELLALLEPLVPTEN